MKVIEQENIEIREGMVLKDGKGTPHLVLEVRGDDLKSASTQVELFNMLTGYQYGRRSMFLLYWDIV